MKKKSLFLDSMGMLACTVGVTALAVSGANQLDIFPVKADPKEYSVTFETEHIWYYGFVAAYTRTDLGNHVLITTEYDWEGGNYTHLAGVDVGDDYYSFKTIFLYDKWKDFPPDKLEFNLITGIKAVFTGNLYFASNETEETGLTNGTRYDCSLATSNQGKLYAKTDSEAYISSLTIYYSC